MVAVKGREIDAYLKAPPARHIAALVFGLDPGAISERAATLAKQIAARSSPPGDILRLDDRDLDDDPGRLAVELQTVAMFGGRTVVRVNASRRIGAALLQPLLASGQLENFLVVEAQNLKADDALRGLFEKSDVAAALACYADEARDLETVVDEVLKPHGLTITPDAKRLLVGRLGADRGLSRTEIEKLALYALGKGSISETDVEEMVGDASELAIDKIILAAGSGRVAECLTECDRALAAGESAQAIIILLQRHFQRLHRIRSGLDQNRSLDDILRTLRPPLHFKQRGAIAAQAEAWTMAKLDRALPRIVAAQRAARGGAIDEALVTEHLLLDLARLAAIRSNAARPSR